MEIGAENLWDIAVKAFEWLGSALLATAIFVFKGYRNEFDAIKKDNNELKTTIVDLQKTNALMLQKLTHIDNNIKDWDNGSKAMLMNIMELEKSVELIQMELRYLKESK